MGVELELKYRATEAQQNRLRRDFGGEEAVYHMETTYYDTPEGFLAARHMTLRKRLENGVGVCTVKAPRPGPGRGEWECRWDGDISDAIPLLCGQGAPALLLELPQSLIPTCGARFTRIAKTINLPGAVVELALDTGVLLGGGRECPLREAEAELKSGSPEALAAFGAELEAAYGLTPEKKSKFARARALAESD